jgi:ABC-type taurine transport system ATPase subunit
VSKGWWVVLSAHPCFIWLNDPFKATDTFTVNEYQKALDKLESRTAFKIVIKPTGSVQLQ